MADMKPEEVANLARLYMDLNSQLTENERITRDMTKSAKERLEAESKVAELQSAQLKILIDLKKNEEALTNALTAANEAYSAKIELLREQQEQAASDIPLLQEEIRLLKDLEAEEENASQKLIVRNKIRDYENNLREKEKILNIDSTQFAKEEIENKTKLTELSLRANRSRLENLEALKKEIDSTLDLKKATDSLTASISQSIATQAGLNNQYNQQIILAHSAAGGAGVLKMLWTSINTGFKEAINPVSMFSTVITNAVQNFQKFYEAMAKMGRELGTTVTAGFNAANAAGNRMGIDTGTQTATVNALGNAFVNLGAKQEEQTTKLLIASYQMQRFGIGTSESVTILSAFQRSLGLSAEKSAELATELVHTARSYGLTSDAVKGLASNMDQFIAYGSRANDVMKQTLEVSSRFGIGTDAIAKMSSKLDTLEGSMNAVNIVARNLGVAIDPIQLLRANPAQKMELLADAIKRSGFEGENARFKIKELGEATGFTAAQIEQLTKQTEQSANAMSSWEKPFKDFDAWFQKFTGGQTLDGLAQMKTLLESASKPLMLLLGLLNALLGLIGFINAGLAWLNEKFGTFFGVGVGDAIAFVVVFSLAIWKMTAATTAASSAISGASGALGTMSASLASAGTAIGTFFMEIGAGAALATEGIPFILAFGAAIIMVGAGVALAAYGMAQLVMSFKGLDLSQIAGAITVLFGFSIALNLLVLTLAGLAAPTSWLGVAVLIAIGAAIALIGFGVKLAAEGISSMISSITELVKAFKELSDVDIDASMTTVVKSIMQPLNETPPDLEVKVKAISQIPTIMKQYSEAIEVFNAAGGATTAQVMTEKFVQSMTVISEKITTTQTTTSGGKETNNRFDLYLDGNYFGQIVRKEVFETLGNMPNAGAVGGGG